jgi:hypothetical protein
MKVEYYLVTVGLVQILKHLILHVGRGRDMGRQARDD